MEPLNLMVLGAALSRANIALTLIVLIATVIGLLAIKRDYQKSGEDNVNDYIHKYLIDGHHIAMLTMIIILAIGEGIYVATMPDYDQGVTNIYSRFLQHLSLTMVNLIVIINLPNMVVNFVFKVTEEVQNIVKYKFKAVPFAVIKILLHQFMILIYLVLTIAIPLWNLGFIAKALGPEQEDFFYYWVNNIMPFVEDIPLSFDPFREFKLGLQVNSVVVMIHLLLSLADGVWSSLAKLEKTAKVVTNRNAVVKAFEDCIKFVADQTSHKIDSAELNRIALSYLGILDGKAANTSQNTLSSYLSTLQSEVLACRGGSDNTRKKEVARKVKAYFKDPITGGKGLGKPLPW